MYVLLVNFARMEVTVYVLLVNSERMLSNSVCVARKLC